MINKYIQNFSDAVFSSLNHCGRTVNDYGEEMAWFSVAVEDGCSIVYIQEDYELYPRSYIFAAAVDKQGCMYLTVKAAKRISGLPEWLLGEYPECVYSFEAYCEDKYGNPPEDKTFDPMIEDFLSQ